MAYLVSCPRLTAPFPVHLSIFWTSLTSILLVLIIVHKVLNGSSNIQKGCEKLSLSWGHRYCARVLGQGLWSAPSKSTTSTQCLSEQASEKEIGFWETSLTGSWFFLWRSEQQCTLCPLGPCGKSRGWRGCSTVFPTAWAWLGLLSWTVSSKHFLSFSF